MHGSCMEHTRTMWFMWPCTWIMREPNHAWKQMVCQHGLFLQAVIFVDSLFNKLGTRHFCCTNTHQMSPQEQSWIDTSRIFRHSPWQTQSLSHPLLLWRNQEPPTHSTKGLPSLVPLCCNTPSSPRGGPRCISRLKIIPWRHTTGRAS